MVAEVAVVKKLPLTLDGGVLSMRSLGRPSKGYTLETEELHMGDIRWATPLSVRRLSSPCGVSCREVRA